MRAVNLLPLDARYKKTWWAADAVPTSPRRIAGLGGIVAGVLALSLVGAYFLAHSTVNDRRETLAEVTQQVIVAEAAAAEIRAEQDTARARLAAFNDVTSHRTAWEKVLRDISRVLPGHAFLQSLNITSPTPAAATVPGGISSTSFLVTGTTSSQPAVALVLDRLALLPWLTGVSLQSSVRGDDQVNFTIGSIFIGDEEKKTP